MFSRMVLLVAMATPEDMRVNAEHIKLADQFVEVAGGTNNNNYANVQLIVEVRMDNEHDVCQEERRYYQHVHVWVDQII